MRELIDRGHIYIAQPPLYKVKRGSSEQYLKDERALEDYLVDGGVEEATLTLVDRRGNRRSRSSLHRQRGARRAQRARRPPFALQPRGRGAGRDCRCARPRDPRRAPEGRRGREVHRGPPRSHLRRNRARLVGLGRRRRQPDVRPAGEGRPRGRHHRSGAHGLRRRAQARQVRRAPPAHLCAPAVLPAQGSGEPNLRAARSPRRRLRRRPQGPDAPALQRAWAR